VVLAMPPFSHVLNSVKYEFLPQTDEEGISGDNPFAAWTCKIHVYLMGKYILYVHMWGSHQIYYFSKRQVNQKYCVPISF